MIRLTKTKIFIFVVSTLSSFHLPFKAGFPKTSIQERSNTNVTMWNVIRPMVVNAGKREPTPPQKRQTCWNMALSNHSAPKRIFGINETKAAEN